MIINIDKLRSCNGIKIRLSEGAFNSYLHNVGEYFTALDRDIKKIKPVEAIDVISTLTSFREYFVSESEWERLMLHCLNLIKLGANKSIFGGIATFSGLTHVAYSIHELASKTLKINSFMQGINELLLDKLDDFLKASDKEEFNTVGNYELITGLSGPFRYLLDNAGDERVDAMIRRITEIFVKRSKDITVLDHKVPGWHYYPSTMEAHYMTEKAPNGVINYGVSHGMGGPLVVLPMAYHMGFDTEGLKETIDKLISIFTDAVYYANDIAYWPGRITVEQYVGQAERPSNPSQMSWCYGSPGILRALYLSGVYMSDDKLKQFATEEYIKIAMIDLDDFLLSQPIVCHGYVGTAAILNLMYLDTGRKEFLHKIIEMTEASALYTADAYFENAKQISGNLGTEIQADLHSHLEGYAGIIHTILSIIMGLPTENEKRLLMI